jgi:hypothetical protein
MFAQQYAQADAQHKARYKGMSIADSRAKYGETSDYQGTLQALMARSQRAPQAPTSQQDMERDVSYGVNVPAQGGLYDDILDTHDKYFGELMKFDTEGHARENLELQRRLSQPYEQQRTNQQYDRLFGQGRLGTTGGSEELSGLEREFSQADIQRTLESIEGGQRERSNLFNLAFSPQYDQYQNLMTGLFGDFYGATSALPGQMGATQMGLQTRGADRAFQGAQSMIENQRSAPTPQRVPHWAEAMGGFAQGLAPGLFHYGMMNEQRRPGGLFGGYR